MDYNSHSAIVGLLVRAPPLPPPNPGPMEDDYSSQGALLPILGVIASFLVPDAVEAIKSARPGVLCVLPRGRDEAVS